MHKYQHAEQRIRALSRQIAAHERMIEFEAAQHKAANIIGATVTVNSLGLCKVLAIDGEARIAVVQRLEDADTDQGYEVPFRAVQL